MASEWTLDDFAKAHKPARATARVGFRQDLWDDHARLEAEMVAALRDDSLESGEQDLAEQVQALEAQMAESEQSFTFQSVGRQAWTKLLAEHPPSPEHREMGSDHNPETFPPAALALSAADPVITLETATAMFDTLNIAQWNRLWNAVLTANIGGGEAPKSAVATAVRRLLAPSSTTAAPEASLEASS